MRAAIMLSFLLLLSGLSQAQSRNNLSVHLGVNYSSVSSVNSTNPDGIFGLNAGAAYKIYLDDLGWFVKPEISYSQEGYLYQRLDYLNFPVALGFDFTDDFNAHIGFQYGLLVGGFDNPGDTFYNYNLAFLVGFEFYPVDYLDIGFRFSNGVKNLVKEPDDIVIDDARTYALQLYVAANLNRFKKKK